MSTITTSDKRINTRSPYYIDSREAPEPVAPPDPIEENTPPTVSITVSKESPSVGETVTLTAVASDSDGTIVSYLWGGTASPQTTVSIDVTNTEVQSKTYYVIVTDDDGDTATASATVHWQEAVSNPIETFIVNCGDTVNEGTFSYQKKYILNVGDKVGDVEIEFLTTGNPQETPVNFELEWNGSTSTSGFIGGNDYYDTLEEKGIPVADINTGEPSTKGSPTTLTINKTASAPSEVNLTATAFVPNDNYSFTLNCPDVEETETFFHTLIGTCTTGDTTFTYTDVNGEPQEVILANGQTELVSAQDGTVSAAICTGSVEKGGQSFDLGTPEQEYDEKTEINIIFDNSGSMRSTLYQLEKMVEGTLKSQLIKFYGNDDAEYTKRVTVLNGSDVLRDYAGFPGPTFFPNDIERFLLLFKSLEKRNSDSTKVVNILFIDEILGAYKTGAGSSYTASSQNYIDDLFDYRDFLNTTSYGTNFSMLAKVNAEGATEDNDEFIENIYSGNNGFQGSKGLSDRFEAKIISGIQADVNYYSRPTYYSDIILQALTEFGYTI